MFYYHIECYFQLPKVTILNRYKIKYILFTTIFLLSIYNFIIWQVTLEVQQNIIEACENSLEECIVNGSVNAQCEDLLSDIEEETNKIITRRRRKTPHKKLNVNFTIVG